MWGNPCASGSGAPATCGESSGEAHPLRPFHPPTNIHSTASPHLLHTSRLRRGATLETDLFIAWSRGPSQEALEPLYLGAEGWIVAHPPLDDLGGVNDGRVIAAAEAVADDRKRGVGVPAAQIHRQLTR